MLPGESLTLIIPAHNAARYLPACAKAIAHSTRRPDQILLVDDASTDDTAKLAAALGFTVLSTSRQSGPALARNIGAEAASGDLLFFLDADCLVHPDTFARAEARLASDPRLAALIGSYDTAPEAPGFVSRFRNLLHSFHHHHGKAETFTFWGACGIVRKEAFFAAGGFDANFTKPSIEDIEFGLRLYQRGQRIALDPTVQIKHRKRWTLASMIRTDIRDRAIPWTRLILERAGLPNDLNLGLTQRLSAIATLLAIATAFFSAKTTFILLFIVFALNLRFYRFLTRHWSLPAALASFPLHLLYFTYSALTFSTITFLHKAGLLRAAARKH